MRHGYPTYRNALLTLLLNGGGASQLTSLASEVTYLACCVLPGMGGFAALEALKTRSSSPCTTMLEAAMMVPELSEFVSTAQVLCCAFTATVMHMIAEHRCFAVPPLQL